MQNLGSLQFTNAKYPSLLFPMFQCQVDRGFKQCTSGILQLFGYALAPFVAFATGADIPRLAPLGLVWETELTSPNRYSAEVESLLVAYETEVGAQLQPGPRNKVGLKVNTRGGRGLSTPEALLKSLIQALERRGFAPSNILIVDYAAHELRQAAILPALSDMSAVFDGCPVLPLDSGLYYDPDWFYDSPLPPVIEQKSQLFEPPAGGPQLQEGVEERKSFLPAPLLFEVDFWINLAVGVDDPALGVDGALANATLWNVSNNQRFLVNRATASAAVAEIAAIPELRERMVLHFLSMEYFQFIAGPYFNSIYTRNEPRLRMSCDPVALDRLLLDRINELRLWEGFPQIHPLPQQFPFAASLGLGVSDLAAIRIHEVATPRSISPID